MQQRLSRAVRSSPHTYCGDRRSCTERDKVLRLAAFRGTGHVHALFDLYPTTTAMTHRSSTDGQISQSLADAAKGVSQLASCGSQARKNLQDALVDLSALQRGVEPEIDTALYTRCQEVYEVHRL
jgi:hypothetical protein